MKDLLPLFKDVLKISIDELKTKFMISDIGVRLCIFHIIMDVGIFYVH